MVYGSRASFLGRDNGVRIRCNGVSASVVGIVECASFALAQKHGRLVGFGAFRENPVSSFGPVPAARYPTGVPPKAAPTPPCRRSWLYVPDDITLRSIMTRRKNPN